MFDALFPMLCQIGIFMLCAQMILHFRPKESYEKYIKFLIGGMVLLQLLIPVMNGLKLGTGKELVLDASEFAETLDARMEAISKRAYQTKQLQSSLLQKEADRVLLEKQEATTEGDIKMRIEPVKKIEIEVEQ